MFAYVFTLSNIQLQGQRDKGISTHNIPQTLRANGTPHGPHSGCHRDQTSPTAEGLNKTGEFYLLINYERSSSTCNRSHKMVKWSIEQHTK